MDQSEQDLVQDSCIPDNWADALDLLPSLGGASND
jgi:hypothetical protein